MRGPSDVFARILPFSFPLLLPLACEPRLFGGHVIGGGAIALLAFP